MNHADLAEIRDLLEASIREDLGEGDITSDILIPEKAVARGAYVAKEELVVSGLSVVGEIVRLCDPHLIFKVVCADGEFVKPGTVLAELEGCARSILIVERVSLNFLQRMSGIASATRMYVTAVRGTRADIVDTRKTVPGHRLLDKYAVRCGGGVNHRMGLFDAILIKNNHLEIYHSVETAVRSVREHVGETIPLEVEVRDLEELARALDGGPDVILLDNFTLENTRLSVKFVAGRVPLESSGRITLENVREYAETGVDRISVGALTHSVVASDINLRVSPLP